jgi:acetyl esterase/lipase
VRAVLPCLRRWCRAGVAGVFLALLAVGPSVSADTPPGKHPVGDVLRDVRYCFDAGDPLKLDLLYPTKSGFAPPYTVVMWVHGGTWVSGSKEFSKPKPYITGLTDAGFVVASMNYSLAPQKKFPAGLQDLTCGVRFLRKQAETYDLNPDRIGAMGGSAGGHLVGMMGVNDGSHIFKDGGLPHFSSNVQAVAALWGVFDLMEGDLGKGDTNKLPSIFGSDTSKWPSYSPRHYVRPGLPPFLLVHGNQDTDVPIRQAKRFARALRNAEDPVDTVWVRHAEHQLTPSGGAIDPGWTTLVHTIVDFFKTNLAPPKKN